MRMKQSRLFVKASRRCILKLSLDIVGKAPFLGGGEGLLLRKPDCICGLFLVIECIHLHVYAYSCTLVGSLSLAFKVRKKSYGLIGWFYE